MSEQRCPYCGGERDKPRLLEDDENMRPAELCASYWHSEQAAAPSEYDRLKAQKDSIVAKKENQLIAERDREWGLALAEIGIAVHAHSVRHGEIHLEQAAAPSTAVCAHCGKEIHDAKAAGIRAYCSYKCYCDD